MREGGAHSVGEVNVRDKNPHSHDIFIRKKFVVAETSWEILKNNWGKKLGVSFQQIQKYEKGINRVEVGRLLEIANIFDVHISFLSYAITHRCLRAAISGMGNFRWGMD